MCVRCALPARLPSSPRLQVDLLTLSADHPPYPTAPLPLLSIIHTRKLLLRVLQPWHRSKCLSCRDSSAEFRPNERSSLCCLPVECALLSHSASVLTTVKCSLLSSKGASLWRLALCSLPRLSDHLCLYLIICCSIRSTLHLPAVAMHRPNSCCRWEDGGTSQASRTPYGIAHRHTPCFLGAARVSMSRVCLLIIHGPATVPSVSASMTVFN